MRYLGPKSLEGLVPEIEDCDIGIIPNHHSAFAEINTPTRIFEYLGLGQTGDCTSGRRAFTDYFDDRSLLFFELGSAEDLARKIEYVCSHPEEVMEIVRRGQEVYQEHSWQTETGAPGGPGRRAAVRKKRARTGPGPRTTMRRFRLDDCWKFTKRARRRFGHGHGNGSKNELDQRSASQPYVLVTPARNEAAFIEKTIESVIHQTVLPMKWVIVDDGSTDKTPEIVGRYLAQYPWIEMVRMPQRRDRSFAGQGAAFNAGL